MPLDPSIPLRQQPLDLAGIALNVFKAKELSAQSARQERELKIREQKAKLEQRETLRKNVLRDTSGLIQRLNPIRYDDEAVRKTLFDELTKAGKDSPNAGAIVDMINLHRQDPQQAFQVFDQKVQQARSEKLIPTEEGKRVNAILDGKLVSAIQTPEGYLLEPKSRQRMPTATLAPARQITGKPGEFGLTTKTKGEIEERILAAGEGIARLEDISRSYKPEFQQIGTRLSAAFAAGKEKAGMKIEPTERKNLKEFSTFKRRAMDNLNTTIKDTTGTAMSIHEAGRITKAAPNAGTGIFDGDSPTVFKSKLDDTLQSLKAVDRRMRFLRKQGFSGPITEELTDKYPLEDFKVGTDRSILDEAQDAINQGADPEAVKARLRERGVDPARLE